MTTQTTTMMTTTTAMTTLTMGNKVDVDGDAWFCRNLSGAQVVVLSLTVVFHDFLECTRY